MSRQNLYVLHTLLFVLLVHQTSSSKAEANLYKNLLQNYSSLVRPVRNPNKTLKVSMKLFLQQIINVDEQNQIVEVNAWIKYSWTDYRLRWSPIMNDNISSVRFMGRENQIWQPDVLLYNSANENFDSTFKSNLVVYNTGEVNWIPPGIFKISCKMDITMFPFDEQICFLKFGSWTYHGFFLDLRIDSDEQSPSTDLSTYISNGEWFLVSAPATRDVTFYKCCLEPYPTIKFYLHLRRRSLYYAFNIIIPSLLISIMTLLTFCLPVHDMSEKIGFQTTILLSVCFFLTILSEMTPTTSESIPLLGVFFSAVTFIVTMSISFTILILNIRYRQNDNHIMSRRFRSLFVEFIPWLMLMRRPGHKFVNRKIINVTSSVEENCAQCVGRESRNSLSSCNSEEEPNSLDDSFAPSFYNLPGERLNLDRKVGEGLFLPRRWDNIRKKKTEHLEKCMKKCIKIINEQKTKESLFSLKILELYISITSRMKQIREGMDQKKEKCEEEEEWKFAAMALDRLCLCIFSVFFVVCIGAIFLFSSRFKF